MIVNIVIGVPSGMKLYSISEARLQAVSTLLRIRVVRSTVSWLKWGHVRNWNGQRTCYLCAALSESTWENFILFNNTICAISSTKLDIRLVFILGKKCHHWPKYILSSVSFGFSFLDYPLAYNSLLPLAVFGILSTWPFYIFPSRILCWKRPTLSTLLCHPRISFICVFLYPTEILKVFFFSCSISPVNMSPQKSISRCGSWFHHMACILLNRHS